MDALLSERYDDALTYARRLHRSQVRKGAGIPYISHLMSVSAMVLEMGGDEDAAISGLLHDSVEDQDATFESVEARFGPGVREIVELCTDASERPKPAWLPRKQAYLERMAEKAAAPDQHAGYLRVALADKLHNARSTRADLFNGDGDEVFDLFRGAGVDRKQRRAQTLAYYCDINRILAQVDLPASPGFDWYREELRRVVGEIGGRPEMTLFG